MKNIALYIIAVSMVSCEQQRPVIYANDKYCLKNSTEAIKAAEKKWIEIYGTSIIDKKPFVAKLENDSIWIIEGSLPETYVGGVPYAEINAKNCQFIKVTHGK